MKQPKKIFAIPAVYTRLQFGKALNAVQDENTALVIMRNDIPTAVLIGVETYLRAFGPEATIESLKAEVRITGLE